MGELFALSDWLTENRPRQSWPLPENGYRLKPQQPFRRRRSRLVVVEAESGEAKPVSRPSPPTALVRLKCQVAALVLKLANLRSPRRKWAEQLLPDVAPRPFRKSPQLSAMQASNDNYRTYRHG